MKLAKKPIIGSSLLIGALAVFATPYVNHSLNSLQSIGKLGTPSNAVNKFTNQSYLTSIVGIAPTPHKNGYWTVEGGGSVSSHGSAVSYGDPSRTSLNKPIVGMASTPDGKGYWLVASDGGVFSYGDASFYGSTGNIKLNKPIVGMASTPDGKGYWLVASDGGIFTFGDASFYGSTGNIKLNKPIVGMSSTPDGKGYWLVASDGGIFTFGSAKFYGSAGSHTLSAPAVGMASTPDGMGYWIVAGDGSVFTYGNAAYYGSGSGALAIIPSNDGKGYQVINSAGSSTSRGDAPTVAGSSTTTSGQGATQSSGAHAILPPNAPANNLTASPSYASTCWSSPGTAACQNLEMSAINNARSSLEGLGPITLPSNFSSLTQGEQAFVILNLERGSRGLSVYPGLVKQLNADAKAGAAASTDPAFGNEYIPGVTGYYGYGGIWAEDFGALGSDYDWMYNDGLGSGNIDCTVSARSGCWGHRFNILYSAPGYQLAMGAGATSIKGLNSIAAIYIIIPKGDVIPTSDYSYTWSQAVAAGAKY